MAVPTVPIDSSTVAIDSQDVTIEGIVAEIVSKRERGVTRVEDYLGIGSPLIYR